MVAALSSCGRMGSGQLVAALSSCGQMVEGAGGSCTQFTWTDGVMGMW